MQKNHLVKIAVDGFSSCGKSTLAKALAKKLGYLFIDSGAMYRAVTYYCLQNNLIENGILNELKIIAALPEIHINFERNPKTGELELFLNGENVEKEIRNPKVAEFVSLISKIKEVREILVDQQRKIASSTNVIMDGRDIGSVVFPDADIKFFVTADLAVRSKRRLMELHSKGIDIEIEEVSKNLETRDLIDSTRDISPLVRTVDAIEIDTTDLTPAEQLDMALEHVQQVITEQNNTIHN